jgi:hypothetical protein
MLSLSKHAGAPFDKLRAPVATIYKNGIHSSSAALLDAAN